MKRIISVLVILTFAFSTTSSAHKSDVDKAKQESVSALEKVEVYYFHATRRCVTCKAVGAVSQELIESKYKENPRVKFIEINIDESGNEELVEKFQVASSGLYVYNGEKIENITAFAFQYAISNPDKLKNKLIQLINRDL